MSNSGRSDHVGLAPYPNGATRGLLHERIKTSIRDRLITTARQHPFDITGVVKQLYGELEFFVKHGRSVAAAA